jgi:lipopolysaccharide/colanic/teichoic acid biosynthesis glycosyltransferase
MYARFFKRPLDFFCALAAILCLSPVLVILTVLGAIKMHGNPFFTQPRPGLNEKIFKLIKFRTMTNQRDKDGNLLPDDKRLTAYGKFLRSTSLDEIPELFNILRGDMAVIGPRPLLVKYLPYYTEREKLRHSIRPGLTGYAQAHGRNAISWEQKFELDVWYVEHLTFLTDVKIILDTVKVVLSHDGVVLNALEDFDEYRKHSVNTVN